MSRRTRRRLPRAVGLAAVWATTAGLGATAFGSSPPSTAWSIDGVRTLSAGRRLIAMSPDGTLLAGPSFAGTVCIFDLEGVEVSCGPERIELFEHTTSPTIAWAPDSSAIASPRVRPATSTATSTSCRPTAPSSI